MDISTNELKSMKSKYLRNLIREVIQEVIKEDMNALVTTKTGTKSVSYKNPAELDTLKRDANVSTIQTTAGQKLKEQEIDEMARTAKGFKLADENFDSSQYKDKKVSGVPLSDIIDYFKENPGTEKSDIQKQFGFVRPQIANALINGLRDAGVLVRIGHDGEVEATPEPGSDNFSDNITGPEAFFIGNSDPLANLNKGKKSQAKSIKLEPDEDGEEEEIKEPSLGDDEEDIPEIEPSPDEIEKSTSVTKNRISDEDYEAFMKYSTLRDRLNATKSNLLKSKRPDIGAEFKGEPGNETERLTALKKSLESRIADLVASSKYLQDKVAKEKAPKIEKPIELEPIEIDDDIEDNTLDEYIIRKMQVQAGIIK